MKKHIKKIIAILLMAVMTLNCGLTTMAAEGDNSAALGSLADSYTAQDGSFSLTTSSRFYVVSDSEPTGDLLQTVQLVQRQFAADSKPSSDTLPIVWGPVEWAKDGDIVMYLNTASGLANEAYELNVAGKATVTASDVDGLLYGANMLQKYLRAEGGNTLTGFIASDTPDTKERTVHLDCGRKYFTKEWICNFIKEMSWMGYNSLEFHFSEDGGFRADFWGGSDYDKGQFQPMNDFSWVCGSLSQSWVAETYWRDYENKDYLSTAELIEICNTAAEYHIDIIPSFDSPAHVDYLTWIFEQNYLSNNSYSFEFNGETYNASKVNGCINYCMTTEKSSTAYKWPDYAAMDITNAVAKAFIFAMYTDIANFFKEYAGSTKFNIGADEVNLSYSKTWDYADFPVYVNELDDMLNGLGYTTRIFNDFIGTANSSYLNESGVTLDSFNSDIEILYWNSPWDPINGPDNVASENIVLPVSDFIENGRTLYNVIQTGTYYCTRVTSSGIDARNPDNRQWQVYYATEDRIYEYWNPSDFGEKGDHRETVSVDESHVAGAYFCLWFDYASLNTEKQIWEGAYDSNSGYTYYLLDRMWSNTIKMWNWDIYNSVKFDAFKTVRDRFGDFPGFTSCSAASVLPTATVPSQAYLADHSELTAVVATKVDKGYYTDDSYAAYEQAYNAAVALNADYSATADQISAAIAALEAAEAALTLEDDKLVISCVTTVNGETKLIKEWELEIPVGEFRVYIPPMSGYKFESIVGAKFEAVPSGDGSGYITGKFQGTQNITIKYTNTPNTNRLMEMIGFGISEQGSYTSATWSVYSMALNAARNFVIGETTTQLDVEKLISDLFITQSKLAVDSGSTEFKNIEKLTETAHLGKQVGLRITTTPDVETLKVECNGVEENLNLCTGKVQTLGNGETVKIWLVHFDADLAGNFTYTINAKGTRDVSSIVSITVK